jgi:hypothetical protein
MGILGVLDEIPIVMVLQSNRPMILYANIQIFNNKYISLNSADFVVAQEIEVGSLYANKGKYLNIQFGISSRRMGLTHYVFS